MAPLVTYEIPPCPGSGQGVHFWILSAAWACRKAGLSAEDAISEINSRITRAPRWREIEDAVERAYSTVIDGRGNYPPPVTASYNPVKLKKLADLQSSFELEDLRQRSTCHPDECTAAEFLRALFLPGERVLIFDIFQSQGQHIWRRAPDGAPYDEDELERFAQPAPGNGVWFLVNPIAGDPQYNERLQRRSLRAVEDLTAFRYLLIESDEVPEELWIKALVQIPLPIVSVTRSGGKSLHSLIRVPAPNEEIWREQVAQIAPDLIDLGACNNTHKPAQLSRLPRCYRAVNQQWQQLLYLNPNADGTPICEL